MKKIYEQMWEIAKTYYEKGREMDLFHIPWITEHVDKMCEEENIDDSIIMPLAILHDIGYAVTGPVHFEKNLKKAHMIAGAKLAKEILEKLNYSKEKIEKICYFISIHDEWINEKHELYKENFILGAFSDFDFLSMLSEKEFPHIGRILSKTPKETLKFIEFNEKLTNRPFNTNYARKLFKKLLEERRKEIEN